VVYAVRTLTFPGWLRVTHFLNILFLSFLARSGLEILAAHPRLYLNDHCRPGSDWLRFTRKQPAADQLWTGKDEEVSFSPWLALPGRRNLGMGRHWHFLSVLAWIGTGLVYVVLLFTAGEWRHLLPTSWSIVPQAATNLADYLRGQIPPPDGYDALQQLTYAGVVFVLAPLAIATGAALSPGVAGRFPGYLQLFGGRQKARSLHFLVLIAFGVFTAVHTGMVLLQDAPVNIGRITLGTVSQPALAAAVALAGIGLIVVLHILATWASLRSPRQVQRVLGAVLDPARRMLVPHRRSRQSYSTEEVSVTPWVNGRPPADEDYRRLAAGGFADWRLEVTGLIERPLSLSLDDLRAMPKTSQTTMHDCIQGWSYLATWSGVPLQAVLDHCRLLPQARYLVFRALDDKATSESDPEAGGYFYGTLALKFANDPQTILAYEMNGRPLPMEHGAPLRLRVETQLGFKMVKYLRAIEVIADYRSIGAGMGGWREDYQFYDTRAGI
jgi:methionine sulfoxide reductase catalytic subunit